MNRRKRAKRRTTRRDIPQYVLYSEHTPDDPALIQFQVGAIPMQPYRGTPVLVGITQEQARKIGFSVGLQQPELADAWKRKACAASDRIKDATATALAVAKPRILETVDAAQELSRREGAVPWMVTDRHGRPTRDWSAYCAGRDDAYRHTRERLDQAIDTMTGTTTPTPAAPPGQDPTTIRTDPDDTPTY